MDIGQTITRVVGAALFAIVGFLAWNYLYPGGVILSVENQLSSADCDLTIDGSEVSSVALKPRETASRLMVFGMPTAVEWICQTAIGPVSGRDFENCGPLNRVLLRPENEFTVMC